MFYIQKAINCQATKRYQCNTDSNQINFLDTGFSLYFVDEHYLYYKNLFATNDISSINKNIINFTENIFSAFENGSLTSDKSDETIYTILSSIFAYIIDDTILPVDYKNILTNGLIDEASTPTNYINTLTGIFSDLLHPDCTAKNSSTMHYYLPYVLAFYLLNNSFRKETYNSSKGILQTNTTTNNADSIFNSNNFRLSQISKNNNLKKSFLKRLLDYSPNRNSPYLEDYTKLCTRFCTKKSFTNEQFYSFWESYYYHIYIFAICAECCRRHKWSDCDYGMSFILFINQLYSKNETITFNEFITFFALYFLGALENSKTLEITMDKEENYIQEMRYQSPDEIFGTFLYAPTPLEIGKEDFIKYVFFMLADFGIPIPVITKASESDFAQFRFLPIDEENENSILYSDTFFSSGPLSFSEALLEYSLSSNKKKIKKSIPKKYHISSKSNWFKVFLHYDSNYLNQLFNNNHFLHSHPTPTGWKNSAHIIESFLYVIESPLDQDFSPKGKFSMDDIKIEQLYKEIIKKYEEETFDSMFDIFRKLRLRL